MNSLVSAFRLVNSFTTQPNIIHQTTKWLIDWWWLEIGLLVEKLLKLVNKFVFYPWFGPKALGALINELINHFNNWSVVIDCSRKSLVSASEMWDFLGFLNTDWQFSQFFHRFYGRNNWSWLLAETQHLTNVCFSSGLVVCLLFYFVFCPSFSWSLWFPLGRKHRWRQWDSALRERGWKQPSRFKRDACYF